MMSARRKDRGMTLIEVVVAMMIFAMLAVMAQRAIVHATGQARRITESRDAFEDIQLAMARLARDIETIAARPVRGADGGMLPPLSLQEEGTRLVFTRGSVDNPAERPRSAYQRVSYFTDADGTATRGVWIRTEPAREQPPQLRPLPAAVEMLRFRVYRAGIGWATRWPPEDGTATGDPGTLPDGVEVTFSAAPWGELRRAVSLR